MEDRSFDPRRIPRAVREAGFEPGEIQVTAVGRVAVEGELLLLRLPLPPTELVLEHGQSLHELRQRAQAGGGRVRIRGRFDASHGDGPPSLTLQHWEAVPEGSGHDEVEG